MEISKLASVNYRGFTIIKLYSGTSVLCKYIYFLIDLAL